MYPVYPVNNSCMGGSGNTVAIWWTGTWVELVLMSPMHGVFHVPGDGFHLAGGRKDICRLWLISVGGKLVGQGIRLDIPGTWTI